MNLVCSIDESPLVGCMWILCFSSVSVCRLTLESKVRLIFYAIILCLCPIKSKFELYLIC